MALNASGELFGWGWNAYGQLGLPSGGAGNKVLHPMQLLLPKDGTLQEVALGGKHSLILMSSGTLYTCGLGEDGQLGTGDILSVPTFTRVRKMRGTKPFALGAGWCHSVSIALANMDPLLRSSTDVKNKVYPWFVRGDMDGFSVLFMNCLLQVILVSSILNAKSINYPVEIVRNRILPGEHHSLFSTPAALTLNPNHHSLRYGRSGLRGLSRGGYPLQTSRTSAGYSAPYRSKCGLAHCICLLGHCTCH